MALARTRSPSLSSDYVVALQRHPLLATFAAAASLLGVAAIVNQRLARKAERDNPPRGQFLDIDGARLHYVERGEGRPLVLLHGNGSMIQDFDSSGLIDLAANGYRVIVFDRPGFGHSSRPRNVIWTPEAQADLIRKALDRIGVKQAIVLGHSWGASVALALAIRHPSHVEALVLASGYYFPTARADVTASSVSAMPGVGDAISHTISPILSRMLWPAMLHKMFGPRSVPDKFDGFPKEMAMRPSQMRASAAEAALMIPAAFESSKTYDQIDIPTIIIAGDEDRLIDINEQSVRLHGEIKNSKLHRIAGAGHMIQQSATTQLMAAIDEAAAATGMGGNAPHMYAKA
ncbi:alpha/beta hydrolase [Bradyrhizobium sp. UNPF46]|uniref:alpha/beta fold hydrolase n=1 Tax=Bradyrhizobium sp. UNPF46 TaxID=1141168 RepID=UPI001154CFC9|nr:alpha/beta hydrolase [Bradyrhizobium sp. UNPF46]TQF28177.1 alpha/beta hydrolase [Bradyrhizobium sp. UNPF46]